MADDLALALAIAGALLGLMAWYGISLGRSTWTWPSVDGQVLRARTRWDPWSSLGRFRVEVEYRYRVHGTSYGSARYGFFTFLTRAGAEVVAYRFPPKKPVTVYYDPRRPERAVLERGTGPQPWLHAALATACFLGALFLHLSRAA